MKGVWYYVTFNSPRYGTRISGFVQESAVEFFAGVRPEIQKKEEKPQPKTEPEKALPADAMPSPVVKEKKEPPPTPPPPPIIETRVIAKLPRSQAYRLPRKEPPLQEIAWKIIEKPPATKLKAPAEVREFALLTAVPKYRPIALARAEETRKDPSWQVVQPVIAKRAEPSKKKEAEPRLEVREKPPERKPETKPAESQPVRRTQVRPPRKGPGLLVFGLGYGSSFGGAGGFLQLNTGTGLSLHAGIGIYPTTLIYSETDWVKNKLLWSVGLKYYLPLIFSSVAPFIDFQYGGLKVEAAQVVVGIWDYQFVLHTEQKSLWGPSLLTGFEYRLGRIGVSAALGAAYVTTSWEYLENKVSLVFDTGLVVHF